MQMLPDNDQAQTDTHTTESSGGAPRRTWSLVVAHHPDPVHVGHRTEIPAGVDIELGRGGPALGPGVLDDDRISRSHVRLVVPDGGQPTLRDCGSHNGTFLNGVRTEESTLSPDAVVGLGRLLLLLTHEPPIEEEPPPGLFPTPCGPTWTHLHATLFRAAPRTSPLLLWGETGAGKDAIARWVHEHSGRAGGFHTIPAHRIEPLPANAAGTIYVDGLEDATDEGQRILLEMVERPPGSVRFIASSRAEPARLVRKGRLRPEVVHRLGRWSFSVPPLRARRCDIGIMALAYARRYAGDEVSLHPELVFRLLRHGWPGNVRELEAIVERAVVESAGDPLVRPFSELGALLASPRSSRHISTYGRSSEVKPFVLHTGGTWFSAPGKDPHDLSRRKLLVRLLGALIDRRRTEPGSALSVDALLTRGWPDETFVGNTGPNRVYVALTTLRKMGLRDLLIRDENGYYLDPDVAVRFEE